MKRLLIVGMGSIGLRHARLYSQLPELTVEVCDSRQEGLIEARAQLPSITCWTDYSLALDSAPDYVLVATPHHLHAVMARAALERDIPVLCEKPMSHDLEEAQTMAGLAATRGLPLAVGYHLRFHPAVRRLATALESGEMGTCLFARYCVDSLITLENSRSRYQASLFGSLLMDYSHGLDLLLHLFQHQPSQVIARGLPGAIGNFEATPLLLSAILGYAVPFQAEIHLSYAMKPELHTLEVISSHSGVLLALNSDETTVRSQAKDAVEITQRPYQRDSLYLAQWKAFVDHCSGRPSPICTFDQALRVNEMMEKLLVSLRRS